MAIITYLRIPMGSRMHRFLPAIKFSAKAVVSVAVLTYLARNVDAPQLLSMVRSANAWLLALAVLQFVLVPVFGGLRWDLILKSLGHRRSLPSLIWMYWGVMTFNQVLPSAVGGDAVRAWMAIRTGINASAAIISVILDRGLMFFGLVTLVALSGSVVPVAAAPDWLIVLSWILLAAAIIGFAALPLVRRVFGHLPNGRLIGLARRAVDGFHAVIHGHRAIPLILLSVLSNVNLCVAAWWLALGLGVPVSLPDLLLTIPLVLLATLIPVSIGGWGVREAAMVTLLAPLGVQSEAALLFSVVFGLAVLLTSLPGLAWLWRTQEERRGTEITVSHPALDYSSETRV